MNIKELNKQRTLKLEKITKPFINYLYEYGDPYTTIVITQRGVEHKQAEISIPFKLRD